MTGLADVGGGGSDIQGVEGTSLNAQQWFEAEYGVDLDKILDDENTLDEVDKTNSAKVTYTRVIPAEKNITVMVVITKRVSRT